MGDLNQMVSLEVRGHLARRRLKRSDVANVLGVSLRTVSDLLGERRPWRVDEVEIVAAWLDIDVSDLLFPKHNGYGGRRGRATKRYSAETGSLDFDAAGLGFDAPQDPSDDFNAVREAERRGGGGRSAKGRGKK